jgi:F-type H+-transporting ATPase subunit delta
VPDSEFQVESMGEVYAQALINEAQKQNVLAEVAEDVRGIGELLKGNPSFLAFTQAVTLGEEEILKALEKIFSGRIHPLTLQVLRSMARRGRLMFLRGLVEGFIAIQKKASGQVDVQITAASELRPETIDRLKQALSKGPGQTANIHVKIDPALIGGMTVQIGDTLIDGSVATQLDKIKEQLLRGGRMKTDAVLA